MKDKNMNKVVSKKSFIKRVSNFVRKVFFHIVTQYLIVIFASFLLFSSDIEVLVNNHNLDMVFDNIRTFMLGFFITEFCCSNLYEHKYTFSFYFIIDFTDLVSLATEVSRVWNPFIEYLESNSM